MIGIVDYDIGNLRSVQKALQHVGGDAVFVRTPEEISKMDALVLPGVGAFGDCVRCLAKSGMWDATLEWAKSERPFFGICVGYQMLFESSEEAPGEKGLGLFEGEVRKFSSAHGLKIPQIGWNTVTVRQPNAPLLSGIRDNDYVTPSPPAWRAAIFSPHNFIRKKASAPVCKCSGISSSSARSRSRRNSIYVSSVHRPA
jgi:glutamine amidotransferase